MARSKNIRAAGAAAKKKAADAKRAVAAKAAVVKKKQDEKMQAAEKRLKEKAKQVAADIKKKETVARTKAEQKLKHQEQDSEEELIEMELGETGDAMMAAEDKKLALKQKILDELSTIETTMIIPCQVPMQSRARQLLEHEENGFDHISQLTNLKTKDVRFSEFLNGREIGELATLIKAAGSHFCYANPNLGPTFYQGFDCRKAQKLQQLLDSKATFHLEGSIGSYLLVKDGGRSDLENCRLFSKLLRAVGCIGEATYHEIVEVFQSVGGVTASVYEAILNEAFQGPPVMVEQYLIRELKVCGFRLVQSSGGNQSQGTYKGKGKGKGKGPCYPVLRGEICPRERRGEACHFSHGPWTAEEKEVLKKEKQQKEQDAADNEG